MQNFNLLRELGQVREPGAAQARYRRRPIEDLFRNMPLARMTSCSASAESAFERVRNTMDLCDPNRPETFTATLPILRTARDNATRLLPWRELGGGRYNRLIIEVHPNPNKVSDGAQSLFPDQFAKLIKDLRIISHCPQAFII